MAEWRLARGWSERGLRERLRKTEALKPNFKDHGHGASYGPGWRSYSSEAVIGLEPPGLPVPNGAFERAKKAVQYYEFSDPAIVTGHFDAQVPLAHRRMLLEIKVFGLRYLCGVKIGAVRSEQNDTETIFGYRYDTLEGHIESGSEWFLLKKNHKTGEVRFRIEASWRLGEFPNWWSKVGFKIVGPYYQRAWNRLAHLRLRDAAGSDPRKLKPVPKGKALFHTGSDFSPKGPRILHGVSHGKDDEKLKQILKEEHDDTQRKRNHVANIPGKH